MTKKKVNGKTLKLAAVFMAGAMFAGIGSTALMKSFEASAATEGTLYSSDYDSKHEAIEAGYKLNLKVAEEGMVLLKNEILDGIGFPALPIAIPENFGKDGKFATWSNKAVNKITVFGYAGAKPSGGDSGNGGDTSGGNVGDAGSVYKTLEAVGYQVNPTVKEFYNTEIGKGNTSDHKIKKAFDLNKTMLEGTYPAYGDAAIIVLNVGDTSAMVGEGDDAVPELLHNRQYNAAQYELIDHAVEMKEAGYFGRVIVLINKSYPVELDDIKNNEGVDAILLVGEGGTNGLAAAGPIIAGLATPSGHLSDTYPVDQTKDPSYVNFAGSPSPKSIGLGEYVGSDGKTLDNSAGFNDYEEGIYNGYRYWETRAADEKAAGNEDWWEENVSYTFGYGLSYTRFSWQVSPILSTEVGNPAEITAKDTLKFAVMVTNEGMFAGKEVVQLYNNAPYYDGGIEKAENVLVDFVKTDLLQPGESQCVYLSVAAKDLASYDWDDANQNGIRGYELENGTYKLRVASCAHYGLSENDKEFTYVVNGTDGTGSNKCWHVKYSNTGYEIKNQFEDLNAYVSNYSETLEDRFGNKYSTYKHLDGEGFDAPMSRAQSYTKQVEVDGSPVTWKGLQVPATSPVDVVTTAAKLKEVRNFNYTDNASDPWYVADKDKAKNPLNDAEREEMYKEVSADEIVKLAAMRGKSFNDPLWETILDEVTVEEMVTLVNEGGWQTIAIDFIGKPASRDTDGPKGWTGSSIAGEAGNMFCAEPMQAATFNIDLLYEIGKNVGDQGLWGSSDRKDGGLQEVYSCWYAPGMNIHRGSFDGRFIEYYSEDPVLTGKMAAAISRGIQSKGGYMTMKHFALHNDGSTKRSGFFAMGGTDGLSAWVDEQALREVYLKAYEICANEGNAHSAMTTFTRFGHIWGGASYALNTELFRNEWGCHGYLVTDIVLSQFENAEQYLRAGGDIMLTAVFVGDIGKLMYFNEDGSLNASKITPTVLGLLRNATKHVLWQVANSNAMQAPMGAKVVYNAVAPVTATVGTAIEGSVAKAALGTKNNFATISYAVTGGALPAGVTMGADGKLAGTPTAAGVYTFTVTAYGNGAKEYSSADDYIPASQTVTIVVNAPASTDKTNDEVITAIGNAQSAITGAVSGSETNITNKIDEVSNKGCGSEISLGAGIAIGASVLMAVAVCVAVKLAKKHEEE